MVTEAALIAEVQGLLRLDANNPTRLTSRENSRLEYKERFHWANRAKYAKTLAAFANASGGFIGLRCEGFAAGADGGQRGDLRHSRSG